MVSVVSQRRKGKKKEWELRAKRPEYRRFAKEVIGLLPEQGELLFVTTGTPPNLPRLKQHRRFAALCKREGWDFVSVLDWGADARDPARLPDEGDGEHQHSIVWTPDRKEFVAALLEWADSHDIDRRSLRWKTITGWNGFSDTGATKLVEQHIARMLSYATKAPKDGRERDLCEHARAGGLFAKAWETFAGNGMGGAVGTVTTSCCPSCGIPIAEGRTVRAEYCSTRCRVRACRARQRLTRARKRSRRRVNAKPIGTGRKTAARDSRKAQRTVDRQSKVARTRRWIVSARSQKVRDAGR
jgi:hypothetical protein